MKLEILIADNHPMIRCGVAATVAGTHDMIVAGEADNGNAALEMVRGRNWDLLVMDMVMPGRSGLELIKLIKSQRPRLPMLVFSACQEEQYAVRAIRAGASGYLCKEADSDILLLALRRVAGGGVFVSQKVTELLATDVSRRNDDPPHTMLTDREFGIFARIVRGATLTDIADELSLSIKTVSTHKSHILDKMTLGGPAEMVRYAIEHKLLDPARE